MTKPPLTPHRLQRLTAWARIWLELVLRLMPRTGDLAPYANQLLFRGQRLADIRRMTLQLIFLRACQRAPATEPARPHHRRLRLPAGSLRIMIGVDLRRALRGRDLRARTFALLSLLRDPEPAIARLAKRLRNFRPRRRGGISAPINLIMNSCEAGPRIASANTS